MPATCWTGGRMRTERTVRYVEFVLWVATVSAAVVVVGLGLGLVIGGSLRTAKLALFVVGFLLFGIGAFAIQPEGPDLSESMTDVDEPSSRTGLDALRGDPADEPGVEADDDGSDGEFGFETRLQEFGPLADHDLPPEGRASRGVKTFTTSLVVLGISFLLEVAGVGV